MKFIISYMNHEYRSSNLTNIPFVIEEFSFLCRNYALPISLATNSNRY